MRNIHIIVAYRGTHYAGWQRQPNGVTVEEKLREAIHSITGEWTTIYGSGRTDAGVHAHGQSANFHTDASIPPERFALAMNTKLPEDIRVMSSREVPEDFHSRFDARGKRYLYQLYLDKIADPFISDYAWQIERPLDMAAMERAAACFEGIHDFAGFMAAGSAVKDTVRTIHSIEFTKDDKLLTLAFTGNGFLYNMVRIITGTLVAVGLGKIGAGAIPEIIASKRREAAGITAPARGLFLDEVFY
ncbi:MAG: tRNA pseudouridine(38-40) synthase TruA [Eubacterium sp.]|nr:tRNA pseudouridine(38-40) synthase TruA [Eubacterium sp.]